MERSTILKRGTKEKNPVKTRKGNKQGAYLFVDPELRTRSEIETQRRSPQGQQRKRMWNKRNGTKETRPRKITIYLKIRHKLSQRPGLGTKNVQLVPDRSDISPGYYGMNRKHAPASKALNVLLRRVRRRSTCNGSIARWGGGALPTPFKIVVASLAT